MRNKKCPSVSIKADGNKHDNFKSKKLFFETPKLTLLSEQNGVSEQSELTPF